MVNFKSKYDSGDRVMKTMKAINVYDLNIMQHLIFMFKFKKKWATTRNFSKSF